MAISRSRRRTLLPHAWDLTHQLTLLALLAFLLLPIYWLLASSLSTPTALLQTPPQWFPIPLDLSRYRALLGETPEPGAFENLTEFTIRAFQISLRNSVIVASGVTLVTLTLGFLAAAGFSRLNVPFGGTLIYLLLLGQLIPVVVLLVPLYRLAGSLNALDQLPTVILLLTALHLPFVIWILRAYLESLPRELEEAAQVDGASFLGALLRVTLPLSVPGLLAAGAYTFMQAWNAFMIPLVFTSSDTKCTVTVAVAMFLGRHYTDYALLCAAGVLAALPPVILALFFQRYLLSGLTAGAVK